MVFEAEDFIWVMADQVDTSHVDATNEKVSKGMQFRFVMEQDIAKTVKITPEYEKFKERKYLEHICVSILINEKEAFVALRGGQWGNRLFRVFFGSDEKFRKWCQNLFAYY
jgi:predicted transcriptional regulator